MSKSSHLELQEKDSEALGYLDSVSLPSEPPDIRNLFSSYTYESPELDAFDGFQDSDGARETCIEEENNGESGNNHPVGEYNDSCAAPVKSSDKIESESLAFSADSEPPDIRNWFSSYVYESPSPLLDTAHDFAISDYEEGEDGKLYVEEKCGSQNKKDLMASINVGKTELCTEMNSSRAVVKGPDLVKDTKLDYQSVCKDHDEDDDDDTLRPLPSILSLSSSDKVSEPMLSGQRAGFNNHRSLEKIGSTNAYGNDYDAKLHSPLSYRSSISLNMENNIGSRDGKSIYRSIEGTDSVKDGLENEHIYETVSPRTVDSIAPTGDSWGSPANRRNTRKENEETELLEDGFISVRKKSRQVNAETNGIKPLINHKKDGNIVRKVLSEVSNFHSQNIVGSTGKWSCPQKNKPDLGPPLKQLRLDQWVRRV